jgi:hypothetical protein
MNWTPDIVKELTKAWETTKDSATTLAKRFGTTKGSIIGKVNRLGLKARRVGRPRKKKVVRTEPLVETFVPEPPRAPRYGTCTLLDLHSQSCRWPMDDGLYCGEQKVRGAYCEEHAERAYIKPKAYRRTGQAPVPPAPWQR